MSRDALSRARIERCRARWRPTRRIAVIRIVAVALAAASSVFLTRALHAQQLQAPILPAREVYAASPQIRWRLSASPNSMPPVDYENVRGAVVDSAHARGSYWLVGGVVGTSLLGAAWLADGTPIGFSLAGFATIFFTVGALIGGQFAKH